MASTIQARQPHWYAVPFRVLLPTFLFTLMSFAVCLFGAILVSVIGGRMHGYTPDLRIAYRHIALPAAITMGCILLVVFTVTEIRHFRRTKALQGILRASR